MQQPAPDDTAGSPPYDIIVSKHNDDIILVECSTKRVALLTPTDESDELRFMSGFPFTEGTSFNDVIAEAMSHHYRLHALTDEGKIEALVNALFAAVTRIESLESGAE